MKRIHFLLLAVALGAAFSGCKEVVITPQYINPLYLTLEEFNTLSPAEQDSVIHADSLELDLMFRFLGKSFVWTKPNDPHRKDIIKNRTEEKKLEDEYLKQKDLPTIKELMASWANSNVVKMFTPPVNAVYPTLDPLEDNLGLILENASDNGIDIPTRHYVAVVWSSSKSIILTDSVVFIALNHFLGENFEGYKQLNHYERATKVPDQLPYSMAEALIASRYPYETTENSTALSRMMYEGALIYIKLKVVPNATLASALGYTTDQLQWLDSHYQDMWETVIGKDMIYSTSQRTIKKLIEPSPSTSVISPEYPGRAGRYLGYRLVLNYMQNNAKTPLTYLLDPKFYNNPAELVLAQ